MIKYILKLVFLLTLFAGKGMTEELSQPGLLLTFDDRNMLHWEKQIPLFAKYNAHVTFFVDHFDELTTEQVQALKNLQNEGHSIGCHGLRHIKAAEFCEKYSVEKYLSEEIVPAIKVMKKNGFTPSCFAYPSSNHNNISDSTLLKYFRHIRSGCPDTASLEKTECAFVKIGKLKGKGLMDGVSFHPKSKADELVTQAKKALDRTKKNNELLVLYAHDIRNEGEDGPRHYITVEALKEILAYAANNHIRLYSFDELP